MTRPKKPNVTVTSGDPNAPVPVEDWTQSHHPFCNFYFMPREGCEMCERFFASYTPKEGDSVADLIERCFPNAKVVR